MYICTDVCMNIFGCIDAIVFYSNSLNGILSYYYFFFLYDASTGLLLQVSMGVYLSTPKTEKISEDGENDKLRYGLSSMQGWRSTMEDAVSTFCFLITPSFPFV